MIVSQSATPEDTINQTVQLVYYIATQEETVLTYTASNMKFAVHRDTIYLSKPKARQRDGGNSFVNGTSGSRKQWNVSEIDPDVFWMHEWGHEVTV